MTLDQAMALVEFLNKRMRPLRWYQWGVPITWDKLRRWAKRLGYQGRV
jgi:hypothetical protein